MKKLYIFLLINIYAFLAAAQGVKINIPDSLKKQSVKVPRIEFVEREYDFGRFEPVEDDTLKMHTFCFKNTGQKPLVVLRAVSSCGCTRPTHTVTPIMPGDTGFVSVGYRGQGQPFGYFRKSVTVYTNDPRSYVRIFIRGELMNPGKRETKVDKDAINKNVSEVCEEKKP
ncbi:MAG: DUF1573 domain-containing protein [Bacteroidales bacterium]|nr:DUF1573 domain-containing protein [Bacteroidales bacterium]MBR2606865.1 DUF1573 domain-containing protein [Bacteroidaceae bacterium]